MKPEMQIPVLAVYYSDIDSKLLSLFIDDVDKDLFEWSGIRVKYINLQNILILRTDID